MKRHAFDGISFFFGLVFVTVASWVLLTDGALDFVDARWVWPVLLVAGGIGLVVPAFRRNPPEPSQPSPPFELAAADSPRDASIERARAELPPDPFEGRS
jgi:hypothetical protein